MSLRRLLNDLVRVVADEAERNNGFRVRLESVLNVDHTSASGEDVVSLDVKRRGGRRPAALINPVEIARKGEAHLRAELLRLDLEQLRDVVAQFGMDPGKLVMKWKDTARVMDRIVEIAVARAAKGDVFKAD